MLPKHDPPMRQMDAAERHIDCGAMSASEARVRVSGARTTRCFRRRAPPPNTSGLGSLSFLRARGKICLGEKGPQLKPHYLSANWLDSTVYKINLRISSGRRCGWKRVARIHTWNFQPSLWNNVSAMAACKQLSATSGCTLH